MRRPLLGVAAAALALAGAAIALGHAHAHRHVPATFGWLHATAAPAHWHSARTGSGATLVYPPGWRRITSDGGAVSTAPAGAQGAFAGYLNATPQSGDETLANWSRFRVAHNADEGARDVRLAAAASGLRFHGGSGSCVIDSYSTVRMRFREIACIVAGAHATTVVVAAAPAQGWASQAPQLERAIAAFAV